MPQPSRPTVALNLTTNTPHNTRIEVNVGALSILFSYGAPVGFDYINGAFAVDGLSKTQQKHLYQWRKRSVISWVSRAELTAQLLASLQTESEALILSASESNTMHQAARPSLNLASPDPIESEVDELDNVDDDDDDDVDFDDDDEDDDDDELDDEDEDDDFLGDDEPDEEGDDDLKENEY